MAEQEKNLNQESLKSEPEDIFGDIEKKPVDQRVSEVKQEIPVAAPLPERIPKINQRKIVRWAIIALVVIALCFLSIVFSRKIKEKSEVPYLLEEEEKMVATTTPPVVSSLKPENLDLDNDGLIDQEEDALGTNKNNPDSDNDGLFDKEEAKIYKTNPLDPDTDKDGVLDGQEVRQGSDPNDPNPEAKLLNLQKEMEMLK